MEAEEEKLYSAARKQFFDRGFRRDPNSQYVPPDAPAYPSPAAAAAASPGAYQSSPLVQAPPASRVSQADAVQLELYGGPSEEQIAFAEKQRQKLVNDLDEQVRAKRERKAKEEAERKRMEEEDERVYQEARKQFFDKSFFRDGPEAEGSPKKDGGGGAAEEKKEEPKAKKKAKKKKKEAPPEAAAEEGAEDDTGGDGDGGSSGESAEAEEGGEGKGSGEPARKKTPDLEDKPEKGPVRHDLILRTPDLGPEHAALPLDGTEPPVFDARTPVFVPNHQPQPRPGLAPPVQQPPGRMTSMLHHMQSEQAHLKSQFNAQAALIDRLQREADQAKEELYKVQQGALDATVEGEFIVNTHLVPKSVGQIPDTLRGVEFLHPTQKGRPSRSKWAQKPPHPPPKVRKKKPRPRDIMGGGERRWR